MPTLRFPFLLANHNKDAAINILIIFISIGSIIFNVNYFHTTIVKNGQIINQPTNAFQSDFSLAALWRNENHAGVKDANPVAVNQETPKLSIALNGIVLTSNDETSFVLINQGYLTSSSSLIQKVKMYSLIILSPRLYVMENRYTGFD